MFSNIFKYILFYTLENLKLLTIMFLYTWYLFNIFRFFWWIKSIYMFIISYLFCLYCYNLELFDLSWKYVFFDGKKNITEKIYAYCWL